MKKTNLFVLLTLVTVLGAGTASFAACTAATFPTGNGVWGIELGGGSNGGAPYDNLLMQVTFASGGTFTGTAWETFNYAPSGPTAITGTWATIFLAGCEYTMTTSTGRTFNFTLNSKGKGGTIVDTTAGYTTVGIMAEQGAIVCSGSTVSKKQYSLYSQGQISGLGLVTGTGEILFAKGGATFSADTTVSLDLGAGGNFVVPGTGTAAVTANCQGIATLTTPVGAFSVETLIVDSGAEILWLVTNPGENVSGYFLE